MVLLISNNHNNEMIINKDNIVLDDVNRIQSHKDVIITDNTNSNINTKSISLTETSIISHDRVDLSKLNSNEIGILQYDSRPLNDYWYDSNIYNF